MKLSKRRLKSLLLAEKVAQELRYQIAAMHCQMDLGPCADLLVRWMRYTGRHKYHRPRPARTWRKLPVNDGL